MEEEEEDPEEDPEMEEEEGEINADEEWDGPESDLDALHRRVRQIENDDVGAENKRLRMMLDYSKNRTRAAWKELDRATW
ncbi:hypothetical protein Tco_0325916, partial [Tanacetum coccineum]